MIRKIPFDAFEYYVGLGKDRSYRAVAKNYRVTKRAVQDCAARECWPERLEKIEVAARQRADQKIGETLDEIRDRHLRTLRAMNARALEALKKYPLNSGMEAVRAAEMCIKLERLVTGEATERTATIEETLRGEYERWVHGDDEPDDEEAEAQ